MTIHVHATYRAGLIHPDHPLNLPEGTELELTVDARTEPSNVGSNAPLLSARIYSPRIAHPEQLADFQMDVREISDAGI